jgi:uncharacterized HAD superfamily protein
MKDNIGIDLDGVVCDIYTDAFRVLKEMYPDKVKEEIAGYMWEQCYGLTEQQVMDCFVECGKKGLLRKAKIYPGAKETLYKLNRRYNINFITWRNYIPDSRNDTLYWLDSNKIPYERLIMTNNKYKVATRDRFVFFLDDNVKQCNRLAKTMVPTFLFSRPWNKREETDALVKTVSSWKEVESILNY